jgi:hypothetical protein
VVPLPEFIAQPIREFYPLILDENHREARAEIDRAVARAEIAFRRLQTEDGWGREIWKDWQDTAWPALEVGNECFTLAAPPHWEAGLRYVHDVTTAGCAAVSFAYGTSGGLQNLEAFLDALTDSTAGYVYDAKLAQFDSGEQILLYASPVASRKPEQSRATFVRSFVRPRLADTISGLAMGAWNRLAKPVGLEGKENGNDQEVDAWPHGDGTNQQPQRRRLTGTVTSAVAARRMEDYMEAHGGQTTFATRARTTDRTLRAFRKTGKVRRDIFEAIAREMGTTPEALLKAE